MARTSKHPNRLNMHVSSDMLERLEAARSKDERRPNAVRRVLVAGLEVLERRTRRAHAPWPESASTEELVDQYSVIAAYIRVGEHRCESLDQLADDIYAARELLDSTNFNGSDLQTWGEGPEDTAEVWSWDATRLLVGSGGWSEMELVARDEVVREDGA